MTRSEVPIAATVLRGREQELSRALGLLRRVSRSGRGGVLALDGEPGIGKTSLLRAIAEQAGRMGYAVGTGKADEIGQIAAGGPLLVALRSGQGPILAEKDFAGLATLHTQQLWLVDRIAGLLEERALDSPVLIGIDDFQWADELTRFALRVLPGRLTGSPVVWLVASRSLPEGLVRQLTPAGPQPPDVEHLSLGPLSPAALGELARDRLGGQAVPALDGVGGNPFYAGQVLEAFARRQGRADHEEGLPAEVIVGVRRRLALLAPDLVELLALCAVWGRDIAAEQAAVLLGGLPLAAVLDSAQRGVVEGLLHRSGRQIGFRHDLLREAMYANLSDDERLSLHRACGRLLLDRDDDVLAAAPHFQAGAVIGDDEAVDVLTRAAARAAGSMPEVAADLARQSFALADPDGGSWLRAGEAAGELLISVHRGRAALDIIDQLLRQVGDPDTRARLQVVGARALWSMNRLAEIGRRMDSALAVTGLSAQARTSLSAAKTLALVRICTAEDATAAAEQALTEARQTNDALAEQLALLTLGVVAKQEGRHETALSRTRSLRAMAGSAYYAEEIRCLQLLDRYDEAAGLLARATADFPDGVDATPDLLHARMWQDVNLGRLAEAETQAETLIRLADELGEHVSTLDAGSVLSFTALMRGDFALARVRLELNSARDADDAAIRATALQLMHGWISLLADDAGHSAALYRPLLATARASREYWPWVPLWMRPFVQAGLATGDHALASAAADLAETGAERNPGVPSFAGLALQSRGLVEGDPDRLDQAVTVLREGPRPLLFASALGDHGIALLAEGEADAAVERIDAARDIYERAGATLPSLLLEARLRQAGLRPVRATQRTPRAQSGWDALTEAELKVAELVGAGHSNRSAAAELGVSVHTIGTHLRSVFGKLDLRSRVQLANALHQRP
ncbi:AAA family ATPase [Amycolatopsis sp. NBC_00345]|uniref:ATP-binding protein n=1 Tax=Amycolatopsis sp. NBC_00345 TaxID=2975955 RepID=UPI002E263858